MTQLSLTERLLERMSGEEALVWDVLQGHVGKENAITNAALARETELDERLVRWCLKSLTEEHRKEIGSLSGRGVFLIANKEEREEVIRFYRNHSLSLLHRMAVLRRTTLPFVVDQLALDLKRSPLPETEGRNG